MIDRPVARSTGSFATRSASQSLMAGVASMYAADSPRMKPMFSTDSAVFT